MKRMTGAAKTKTFADRFSAIGAEPRLRIMQCLITSPRTVGEIQNEIGIPWSTLSHHLEKLRHEELVTTRREGSFLWYRANKKVLGEMMGFLLEKQFHGDWQDRSVNVLGAHGEQAGHGDERGEAGHPDGELEVVVRA
jgi:DNA-binding transcriptional ArsR family regulator